MKKRKILYWIFTGLMAVFMLMGSIPDILQISQARDFFKHLGYPTYLLPFLGTAKTLGVAAVLVHGFRRLKEWAYAGLVFDLAGALYSHLSVGDPPSIWVMPLIGLVLVSGSYLFYQRVSAHGEARNALLVPKGTGPARESLHVRHGAA